MDFASLIALSRASNACAGAANSPSSPLNDLRHMWSISRLHEIDGGTLKGENVGSLLSGDSNQQDRSRLYRDSRDGCVEMTNNCDASLGDSLETTEQSGGHDPSSFRRRNTTKKRRDVMDDDECCKLVSSSCPFDDKIDCNGKRPKRIECCDRNVDLKVEDETSPGVNAKAMEQSSQPFETSKQDYIHVRARRGQATDSHSLAERARREKISERMKILQDLVPGCNKVIGKAMVLDEIINYIQALQNQVEFLSMKLEAIGSRMKSSIEALPARDIGTQAFEPVGVTFSSQSAGDSAVKSPQEWVHMPVGGRLERRT